MTPCFWLALAMASWVFAVPGTTRAGEHYDTIIRNGRIIDGAGNPWYRGDLAIREGRIAAVGWLDPASSATRVIDAADRYVTPGFIDVHTHCEGDLTSQPEAENFVRMGVTTIVTGNCGGSYLNLGDAFTSHAQRGIGLNMASLIGHNTVRREVMGNRNRAPTTTETEAMKALVARAMEDGAVGFSTGLIYTPGLYAKTPEIAELAAVAARYGGLYATHMRSEGLDILSAIDEALSVGLQAKIPVQISHFKIVAPKRHGQSTVTIGMVEEARRRGQDVTVDQYVYTASSTGLRSILPDAVQEGTTSEVIARINDPAQRQKIIDEMIEDKHTTAGRPDMSYAVVANFPADPSVNGMNLKEIALRYKNSDSWQAQMETVLDIVTSGGASMVFHSIDEGDLRRIAQYPFTMFASDSGVRTFGLGAPHPRGYGNNARVLAHYVRDEQVLRLEDAVRRMTSLPAQRFRFHDRGLLRPGAAADIVIFDLNRVQDRSTFDSPHAYAEGFDYVFVNGVAVIDDGILTRRLPGQILYGPGRRKPPTEAGPTDNKVIDTAG
ncbi:MAG: D-aminoacylase [Candidatus Sumerlaeaceae bacterium]|nr:D-aminoacylase [Candidatus Sumerlaeaceae bacterium]